MRLTDIAPKLAGVGVRPDLLRLHKDLLNIEDAVRGTRIYYPDRLTSFEQMVIVLEDRRFLDHIGIDIVSVFRETPKAMLFRGHGGASTIDMQFVRTVTGYKARKISRKIYEILLSVIIQRRYTKIEILRSYLRLAYFGGRLVGSHRVSGAIFKSHPDELDLRAGAYLAAMLVYPRPKQPTDRWLSRVSRRAQYGMRVHARYKKRLEKFPG